MKSYITSIGIANPSYCIAQNQIADFMSSAIDMQEEDKRKLRSIYRASGIDTRFSVLEDYTKKRGEFNFYSNSPDMEPFPSVSMRMKIFEKEALGLALIAVKNCFAQNPGIDAGDITHLITVSCTGMYAPGLDIELIETLGLRSNIQRTAINFMGCYAAFNALKIADAICKSNHEANILIVDVELCSIHFQKNNSVDNIISNALFGDGAAAVLVSAQKGKNISLALDSFYCDLAPEGKGDMAWHISDFGFEMTLSSYVPSMIEGGIKKLTDNLLDNIGLSFSEIDYFAIHPGGKRILEAIEKALGISKEQNKFAYQILKAYGNMSSATVLFVLDSLMKQLSNEDEKKNILSFAFGPGLTMESMLLSITLPEMQKVDKKKSEYILTNQG